MLGAVSVVGGQFGEGRFAAPQSAIKVRQSDRLGLVALQGAARASGKGGVQNGFSPFGQPCQPLHVHQVLLRAFDFDLERQVVKESAVFVLLKGLGKAVGTFFHGIATAVTCAIGKQQGQRIP